MGALFITGIVKVIGFLLVDASVQFAPALFILLIALLGFKEGGYGVVCLGIIILILALIFN